MGRVVAQAIPANRRTTFGYDAVGNQTFVLDPREYRVMNTYDALGRVTRLRACGGATVCPGS